MKSLVSDLGTGGFGCLSGIELVYFITRDSS
jgi:hypothetical protein